MLDTAIIQQVREIFAPLSSDFTFKFLRGKEHEAGTEMTEFFNDFVSTSDKLHLEVSDIDGRNLSVILLKNGVETGISFRGIPNGHEFTSLLLAILNADGKGKNLPDEGIIRRIQALKGPVQLTTYVSLTCTNCPDVVQALQIISLNHPGISHTMIDGGLFEDEVDNLKLQGVPAVFANGQLLHMGRGSLGELLGKLEETIGVNEVERSEVKHSFDVVVIGGGPAGASAAIYSARKGLKVAVVAERIGGQVKDTVGIENLISVPYTTGDQLADALRTHMAAYPIELFENRRVESVEQTDHLRRVHVVGGEIFETPALIIAAGAGWRRLNVEGESEHIGHGVAFCPHCDGPFYKGKHVAVIGGGNSGVEAAIDLAGICSKVTLIEFGSELRADGVLQDKARSLDNVEILTDRQTLRVNGNGEQVTSIDVRNRKNDNEQRIELNGVFVQIGLSANSKPFADLLSLTPQGEIQVDEHCRTSLTGIYAAGDVTNVPYKQIIISMGEGAKAALSAFDDRIRGII